MTQQVRPPRLSSPSALRNAAPILEVVQRLAPSSGRALELASGTGEHAVRFAPALPGLTWQPSDIDPARLASIAAYAEDCPSPNLLPPIALDAAQQGWSAEHGPVDFLFLVNLLHLISDAAAEAVLTGIADVLAPGGIAVIYGPFLRDGAFTSAGDAAFDAAIRTENPGSGYKDVIDVSARLVSAGLAHVETVRMPANNLLLCFERRYVTP